MIGFCCVLFLESIPDELNGVQEIALSSHDMLISIRILRLVNFKYFLQVSSVQCRPKHLSVLSLIADDKSGMPGNCIVLSDMFISHQHFAVARNFNN